VADTCDETVEVASVRVHDLERERTSYEDIRTKLFQRFSKPASRETLHTREDKALALSTGSVLVPQHYAISCGHS
jgi:hypothetical protein